MIYMSWPQQFGALVVRIIRAAKGFLSRSSVSVVTKRFSFNREVPV